MIRCLVEYLGESGVEPIKDYQIVSPTTYCHLNPAVPILRLYFEDGADLRPNFRLQHHTGKLFNSVKLQAITDHQGKFLDIFVVYPGSVHDARVLKNSPVYTGRLFPPAGKCILGDGGYPCLSAPICLMTP
ncbi:hypothetical protein DPEC_G00043120 [Dallia pectoralis]|uniref:Uncharacterized protein n=1 Tax=Dallia pectoralis TaxID=75939 RepID=A0ACC2H959_DALPE|nr:hypothetical protein DPEC_G00043120 [Dallia pectoralis]